MIWVRQYQGSTLANWASKAQERPTLIFWKARFHPQAKWLLGKDKSPSVINSTHSFSRTQIIARQAHIFTCKKCVTNNSQTKFFHQNFHGQRIYNCMEKFDCGCYGRWGNGLLLVMQKLVGNASIKCNSFLELFNFAQALGISKFHLIELWN